MASLAGQSIEASAASIRARKTANIARRIRVATSVLFSLFALLSAAPASRAFEAPGDLTIAHKAKPPKNVDKGDCPPEGKGQCGEPVSLPTGNVFEQITDYVTVGQNPLAVTRFYNSPTGIAPGAFGNWRWTYDRSLIISSTEVDAYRPDGKAIGFYAFGPGVTDLDLQLNFNGSNYTLTDWNDTVETYTTVNAGTLGLLTSIKARNGYTQTLQYNANNLLVLVTDSYGRKLTITYNANGLVSSITAPDGLVLSYTYDSYYVYLLTHVGYSTAPATGQTYLYEDTHFVGALTGIIDENGNRFVSWTYDDTYPTPRATSSQHAGGVELTKITYNADGSVTVTRPLGVKEVYKFTMFNASTSGSASQALPLCTEIDRLATSTTPAATRHFTYDGNGYIASSTDWNGKLTTYTHDARGNELTRAIGSGTAQALTITTAWDPTLHVPTKIIEGNKTYTFTYDASGQLLTRTLTSSAPSTTSAWTYTYSNFLATSVTDPLGHKTSFTYDATGAITSITNALGQKTQITQHLPGGLPKIILNPNGLQTTLVYDARNRLLSKTEAQWVTTYAYDAVGDLTKITRPDGSAYVITYDAAHRMLQITDTLGNHLVRTLNAAGNVTLVQVLNSSNAVIKSRSFAYDPIERLIEAIGVQAQTKSYSYDSNNNILKITDPLSKVTMFAYDPLNRLTQSTDPNGGTIAFSYDAETRAASIKDPRGLITSYAYDGLDDVISITSPDTGATTKTYDAAGNAITSTDARGKTTTYTRDALNRVTKAAFADGTSVSYQYDQGTTGIGQLTTMVDGGGTTTWTYDVHSQVTSKQQKTGAVTLTTTYAYNAVTGRLNSVTYPSGKTISYAYDSDGRVNAISYKPLGGTTTALLTQIAYQPFGPVASWHQASGANYARTFNKDGFMTGVSFPGGVVAALSYDAANRITGITETGLAAKTFGYDALGRVTHYTSGTATQTYTYDLNGNRSTFTASSGSISRAYHYAATSNRLLSISGSSAETFTYDAAGNMLSHVTPLANDSYVYDARNRRTQVIHNGGSPISDVINGLGQRTIQTSVGNLFYIYDNAGHLIGNYNATGGLLFETVWLDGLPAALLTPSGVYFIAPDHVGAPHRITNASGTAVWTWDHDPFGNGTPIGTGASDLRFPGQIFDHVSGLYYNYFRDYDPTTGRYIESDPIGVAGGINTYAYAMGNPLSYVDSFGLKGALCHCLEHNGADFISDLMPWSKAQEDAAKRILGPELSKNPALVSGLVGLIGGAGTGFIAGATTGTILGIPVAEGGGTIPAGFGVAGAIAGGTVGGAVGLTKGALEPLIERMFEKEQSACESPVKDTHPLAPQTPGIPANSGPNFNNGQNGLPNMNVSNGLNSDYGTKTNDMGLPGF